MPPSLNFSARLAAAWRATNSLVCVGLDPEPKKFPDRFRDAPGGIFERSLRPGRAAGYEYRLRGGVTGEHCHGGTLSPQGVKGVTTGREPCHRVTLNEKGMSEGSALAILRAEWAELIGAPSRFFDGDVLGLVTPRRPPARALHRRFA